MSQKQILFFFPLLSPNTLVNKKKKKKKAPIRQLQLAQNEHLNNYVITHFDFQKKKKTILTSDFFFFLVAFEASKIIVYCLQSFLSYVF